VSTGDQGTPAGRSGALGYLGTIYAAHGEKLRYLIVGGGNTILGYGMFLVMLALAEAWLKPAVSSSNAVVAWLAGHDYLVAQLAAWALMVPVSTTSFKYLVFHSKGAWAPQVARSYLVYAPAQGVSALTLWLAVRIVGLSPALGQIIAVAAATIFSYLGHKHFTFKAAPWQAQEPPRSERLDG